MQMEDVSSTLKSQDGGGILSERLDGENSTALHGQRQIFWDWRIEALDTPIFMMRFSVL